MGAGAARTDGYPVSMRAASYIGDHKFEFQNRECPDPASGEVRVQLEACGICGSDLHLMHAGLLAVGHTPGHEMAGRIEAVGPGVDHLQAGQRVAIEPLISCGECRACQEGRDSCCPALQIYGIHQPGGLAESLVIPAHRAYPVAEEIEPAIAALCEPIAVAVHGLMRARFEKDERVLILGAGSIGLVTLLAARHLGAKETFITARHAHQAETALALGADHVLDERNADAAGLGVLGSRSEIDVAVETVGGGANTLLTATAALRPGGRVSVLGMFLEPPSLSPLELLLKEVDLCWSNCYHRNARASSSETGRLADYDVATDIVDHERERLGRLITHQFPLADIDQAFATAADKKSGALKVSISIN